MTTVRELRQALVGLKPDMEVVLWDGPRLEDVHVIEDGGMIHLLTHDQIARRVGMPTRLERVALDDPGPLGDIARDVLFGEPEDE